MRIATASALPRGHLHLLRPGEILVLVRRLLLLLHLHLLLLLLHLHLLTVQIIRYWVHHVLEEAALVGELHHPICLLVQVR